MMGSEENLIDPETSKDIFFDMDWPLRMDLKRCLKFSFLFRLLLSVGCGYQIIESSIKFFQFSTTADLFIEGPADYIHSGPPKVGFSFCFQDIDIFDTATLLSFTDDGVEGYLRQTDHLTAEDIEDHLTVWEQNLEARLDLRPHMLIYDKKIWEIVQFLREYISKYSNSTGILTGFWRQRSEMGWTPTIINDEADPDPLMYLIDFTWNELGIRRSETELRSGLDQYLMKYGYSKALKQSLQVKHDLLYDNDIWVSWIFEIRPTSIKTNKDYQWYKRPVYFDPLVHFVHANRNNQTYLCNTYYYEKQFGTKLNYDLLSTESMVYTQGMKLLNYTVDDSWPKFWQILWDGRMESGINDELAIDYEAHFWSDIHDMLITTTLYAWHIHANFHHDRINGRSEAIMIVHHSRHLPGEDDILLGLR